MIITRGDAMRENDRDPARFMGRLIAIERNHLAITDRGRRPSPFFALIRPSVRALLRWIRKTGWGSLIAVALLALGAGLMAEPAAAQADLGVTHTASAAVVAAGTNVTYTATVTNSGPNASLNAITYMNIPANTTFQSGTVPTATGWTCTLPPVNSATPIICNNPSFASGATSIFTFTVQILGATAAETSIQNVISVTSSTTNDPVGTNDVSVSQVLVGITGDADLSLALSANPSPVFVSGSLVYSMLVNNLGVANATSTIATNTLPTQVTYVSASATQGTCSQALGVVTCALGTLTAGSAATITINVVAPGTSVTLTDSGSTSSALTDPFPSNNSASVVSFVQPLACATPARDGNGGSLTGIVNTYFPPSAPTALAAGATSVSLGTGVGSTTPIAPGDLLLFMQMQDAAINSTDTSSYGDGAPGDPGSGSTNLNSSGRYEYVVATSAVPVTGGTLTFTGAGPGGGLLNTYTSSAYIAGTQGQKSFQVIRVPQYQSAVLSSSLVPLAWNGAIGGVLVLDVAGQLTLGGLVSANGVGFRGGAGRKLNGSSGGSAAAYRTLASALGNGSKGEGIAGTPQYVANATLTAVITNSVEGLPNGSYARGAPGNAGGGGTDNDTNTNTRNSGGGGGGNGSAGGYGGFAWSTAAAGGGFGGAAFPGSVSNITLGGGGGAGTTNDGTAAPSNSNPPGINSSGAAGGGIIITHAGSVVGTGSLTANGQGALNVAQDGGGGGGAGGSIEFLVLSGGITGATLSANGGNGGNTWQVSGPGSPYPGNRHGPGGGGGGGVLLTTSAPLAATAAPGQNGVSTTISDAYGATPGQGPGVIVTNLGAGGLTQIPGERSGAECAVADLFVTNSGTPNPVVPGGTITYTQTVGNNGPQSAVNVVFNEAIPTNTTFSSLSSSAPWTCTTPAVGGTGNISCIRAVNDISVSSSFTLAVLVGSATPAGTTIGDTDSVSSGTNDTPLTNNSATVNILVALPASADIAVTNSASPSTVAPSANVTYVQSLTNNGPSTATTVSFTGSVPANTTFVSLSSPVGWSCTTPSVGGTGTITCTIASLGVGATGSFTFVAKVNAGVASGTVVSDTVMGLSSVTDPSSSNNSASANVTVALANQADLSISKAVTPNPILAGNNLTYTLTLTNSGPSSATLVQATDSLPAQTTFVSAGAAPAGFACSTPSVGGTGTISCTNSLFTASTSGTYSFIVNVAAGTTPGTVISNTASISSTTTDPNSANNSAAAATTVTAPSQADLSITKVASPEPVNLGDTLTYTITVNNNGPASASGVAMTDTLPSAVTFQSVSSLASCSQSAGTVNCTIGTMASGQTVIITISCTATTMSTSSLATNTATVTSTTSDPNAANNTASVNSTIISATAAKVSRFDATRMTDGSVVLEWHTLEESNNLGFDLYREDARGRNRLNPSLIAGSALLLRGAQPGHGAKTYRWIDRNPDADSRYSLEDLDLGGHRTSRDSVTADSPVTGSTRIAESSPLLADLHGEPADSLSASTSFQVFPLVQRIPNPAAPLQSLEAKRALKVLVHAEGWYRLTGEQLLAAGFESGDINRLQLYAEGGEQPMRIVGQAHGALEPATVIEFYGTGIDTPYSGTRVYWLVEGSSPGTRVLPIKGPANGSEVRSFPSSVLLEQRTTYFAALLNGENNDNFFGAELTSEPTDQVLTANHLDPTSTIAPILQVRLQGVTDAQAHRVSVDLNGSYMGEMDFTGQSNFAKSFVLDQAALREGANTVSLAGLAGENDISLVQSIALTYPRTYVADRDFLEALAAEGSQVRITNFTNSKIHVFDVTDPSKTTELEGSIVRDTSSSAITIVVPGSTDQQHCLIAVTESRMLAPDGLSIHQPTSLTTEARRADLILITHPDFAAAVSPLKELRENEGFKVAVVTIDQIFDAFNFGERSPFAVRDYLATAARGSKNKLQSVLFIGDASLDPRNYLGFGDFDFVPTRIIETTVFKTASDDWFSDFKGNGFATIATGRLPVRTLDEATLVISKIVNYASKADGAGWKNQALLIGDQNVGADFTTETNLAASSLPDSLAKTILLADGQDPSVVRQQILTSLNSGQLLVNYLGHGSVEQWSFSDLLDDSSANELHNGDRLPVYLLMDCLNGFFQDVYTESLAESLLLAPGGGAVAVWASSGFTGPTAQGTMNLDLLHILQSNAGLRLGRAILESKRNIVDKDVRRTWILFGDPTMLLQLPSDGRQTKHGDSQSHNHDSDRRNTE